VSNQVNGGQYLSSWWVYFVAEFLASGCAAGIFYICNFEEYDEKLKTDSLSSNENPINKDKALL
jgi:hypothetical protein